MARTRPAMNKRPASAATLAVVSALLAAAPSIGRGADLMDDPPSAVADGTSAGANEAPSTGTDAAPSEAERTEPAGAPDSTSDVGDSADSWAVPLTAAQVPQAQGAGASIPQNANESGDKAVINYEQAQSPPFDAATTEQFMMEDENDLPLLGVDVRLDQRKLKSGESVSGLLVLAVSSGSPAAVAGLQGFSHKVTSAVETVAMAAAMIVPVAAPAVMVVPLLESSHVGEHYDLIVAIDGYRVTNLVDIQDAIRNARPGETVYLSIIRDGKRLQVPLKLQRASLLSQYPQ